VRVEHDAVSRRVAPGEPGLPRVALVRVIRISVPFSVFLTGDAADEPGVNGEPFVKRSNNSFLLASSGRHRLISVRPSTLATIWQIT
jgi:hypothetical protein